MKKLVFFFQKQHVVSGSLVFLLSLARHIAEGDYGYDEVYYVNKQNPEMDQMFHSDKVKYCNIDSCDFSIFEDADFFLPVNHLFMLLERIGENHTGKIMLYDWHPHQIVYLIAQFYNIGALKKGILTLFHDKKALYFMDKSCSLDYEKHLGQQCDTEYIPVFLSNDIAEKRAHEICNPKRISIGWMSRLDGDKITSLINLLDNLLKVDTELPIDIHIIGDGDCRNKINIMKYAPKIRFIFTSYLMGEMRDKYISENVDCMVVMGISALDVANLTVPVIIPCLSQEAVKGNRYVYLYDTSDYSLGWDQTALGKLGYPSRTIAEIVSDIYLPGQKVEIGEKCYDFLKDNFNIEVTAEKFINAMSENSLTAKDCFENASVSKQLKDYFFYKRIRKNRDYNAFIAFNRKRRLFSKEPFGKKVRLVLKFVFSKTFGLCVKKVKSLLSRIKAKIEWMKRMNANKKRYRDTQKSYPNKIAEIQKQVKENGVIRVAFLVIYASTFPSAAVFEKMKKDPLFDPKIIVIPDMLRSYSHRIDSYQKTFDELKERYGDDVISGYDHESNFYLELGDDYPVIFFSNPYIKMAHKYHHVTYFLSKNVLPIYINYGFAAIDFNRNVIRTDFYNLVWRAYLETKMNKKYVSRLQWIHGYNTDVVGYSKMDRMADIQVEERRRKRILICPHHTVMGWSQLDISNFLSYSEFFVELPKKYPEIDFVFRPHPLLFNNLVEKHIWSKQAVEDYLNRLLESPNMVYSDSGDYFDLFVNSDGMIHDCGSFTAEYLYTEKPCCYMLKSKKQIRKVFQPIGRECLKNYYKCYSQEDMVNFIENVIIAGNDPLQKRRIKFSRDVLKEFYPKSTDKIIDQIKDTLIAE